MSIKRKLKSQTGFSLAETLLATLILLLVSVLMANGIPTAKTVYEKVTIGANARVLLTTTVSTLRNELGTAKSIAVDASNNAVIYHSTDTKATSKIYLDSAGHIMLQEYAYGAYGGGDALNGLSSPVPARRLVTAVSATEKLYVTFTGISRVNDNLIEITGLQVKREGDGDKVYATLGTTDNKLKIRVSFGPVTVK